MFPMRREDDCKKITAVRKPLFLGNPSVSLAGDHEGRPYKWIIFNYTQYIILQMKSQGDKNGREKQLRGVSTGQDALHHTHMREKRFRGGKRQNSV